MFCAATRRRSATDVKYNKMAATLHWLCGYEHRGRDQSAVTTGLATKKTHASTVNIPAAKNLVGAFHQPVFVAVDPLCLKTLEPRDVRAGLGESIKHALITSEEFLEKYCLVASGPNQRLPIVMLRMGEDEAKTCQLVDPEKGCTVYEDRPWACRAYPVGIASPASGGSEGEKFYFLHREEVCQGFEEEKEWTVREWLDDQGIDEYDEWGEQWKEITLHEFFETGGVLSPEKMHMMFTACYDLDKFREFVFNSTLLKRFEVDEDFVEEMRYDDEALLRFAFLWLRFSLFGEPTVKAKAEVVDAFKGSVDKKRLFSRGPATARDEDTP